MMADAPEPGIGSRIADAQAAETIITLTIRDRSYRFAPNNVPIGEQEACLRQTGLPYETFLTEPFGVVKLCALWWLARRASGERNLSWNQAKAQWPADLTEDEVSLTVDEPDEAAADPEA
jgi:hypothetical protein